MRGLVLGIAFCLLSMVTLIFHLFFPALPPRDSSNVQIIVLHSSCDLGPYDDESVLLFLSCSAVCQKSGARLSSEQTDLSKHGVPGVAPLGAINPCRQHCLNHKSTAAIDS